MESLPPPPAPVPDELPEPPPFVVIPAPPVWVPEPVAAPIRPTAVHLLLAGAETGVLGALLMMIWFALDSLVEQQHWWAILNLWGAAIYGDAVFRMGLSKASLAGGSLHVVLGGLAGAGSALVLGRLRGFGKVLPAGLLLGALWYVLLQHGLLRGLHPLIERMTPQPATLLAHLLYAVMLTRIPGRGLCLAQHAPRNRD